MARDIDFSAAFNSDLPDSASESRFRAWLINNKREGDLKDYDLRGWWKEHGSQNLSSAHLTDKFKKPNHPTFSDESIHNNRHVQGGRWEKKNGKWYFIAGPANIRVHGEDALKEYFRRFEPDAILLIPKK